MKKLWKWLAISALAAGMTFSVCGLTACDDESSDPPPAGPQIPAEPVQLSVPNIRRVGNTVSWEEVTGATSYKYKIDDGEEKETITPSVTLQEGQSCKVKAVGDGIYYTDSDWSNSVTYKLFQLSSPHVVLTGNVATWTVDTKASGYVYKIDGGAVQTATSNSVPLSDGQSIVVKAVGNGVNYKDSIWSNEVRYVLPTITYNVTLNKNIAAGGTVTGAGTYGENSEVTITATANEGYTFMGWSDGDNNATRTITLTGNLVLTAKFAINTYTVEVSASEGGTVTKSAASATHGSMVTITATANEGYHFVKWSDGNTSATRTITLTDNFALTAEFEINTYMVVLTAGNGGTVTKSAASVTHGSTVTITAIPNEGYTFTGWSDGDNNASRTITVTSTIDLEASFKINTYAIDTTAGVGGAVTGDGNYDHGENVTLVATPATDYTFDGWYENNQKINGAGETYTFTATKARTLEARFKCTFCQITLTKQGEGTIEGGGKIAFGEEVSLTATAASGYVFDGWYENNQKINGAGATYTFTATEDRTLKAKFSPSVCTVSVTAKEVEGKEAGTVEGGATKAYGESITVRAKTNQGYTFDGWYDGESSVATTLAYTFTVTGDVQLEARWKINTYTLTLTMNMEGVGTVSGAGSYKYGEVGTITATTTNNDYVFAGWYENGVLRESDESYTHVIEKDIILEARWELKSVTLTLLSDFDIAGTLTGEGTYHYNDTVTLRATPNNNYTFLGWYDEDGQLSTNLNYIYQVSKDIQITAKWQDDWVDVDTGHGHKAYAYYTMPQHDRSVMPIVGFNSPNAATIEIATDVAQVHGSYPSQINDYNYQMMKDAGINTIVGWWNDWMNSGLQDDIMQELDLAEKYGISYIVSHRDAMYVDHKDDFADNLFRYMRKPAYGGTILIDEPGAVNFADIATATRVWEQSTYNDTLAYVNMLPNYAADWQLNDCQGTGGTYTGPAYSGYQEWIQRYLEIVEPEVFSYDHYPYLFTQPTFFRDGWYTNLSNVRYYTARAGVPYWVYGQLGGWPEYGQVIDANTKHLTFGHTALQFNSMLSYGAKGIQYYNYFGPPNYTNAKDYTSATMADGTPTPFYAQIQRINKQVAAVDDVLLRSAWKGIIQLNSTPAPIPDGDKLSNYAALTSASAKGNAIVGCFEYRDIGWAYYVTTNDVYWESTVTLNFDGNYNLRKVQNGESTTVSGNSITMTIDAGDGVLVVVPKN